MKMVGVGALQKKVLQQLASNEDKGWELRKGEPILAVNTRLTRRDGYHACEPERSGPETVLLVREE
jgi:hypothetical protein